jgi:hypothetical protein
MHVRVVAPHICIRKVTALVAAVAITWPSPGRAQDWPAGSTVDQVEMEIEWGEPPQAGIVTIQLYPAAAPRHVNNFKATVEAGLYDGVIFHRVLPAFIMQGGDINDNSGAGGRAVIWNDRCNGMTGLTQEACAPNAYTIPDECPGPAGAAKRPSSST